MKVYSDAPTPLKKTDVPAFMFPRNARNPVITSSPICANNHEFLELLCGTNNISVQGITGRVTSQPPHIPVFTSAMQEETRELLNDVRQGKRKFSSLIYHARGLMMSIMEDSMKAEILDTRRVVMANAVTAIGEGHRETMSRITNAVRVILGKDVVEDALKRLKSTEIFVAPLEGSFLASMGGIAESILSRYSPQTDTARNGGVRIFASAIKAFVQVFKSDRSAYRKSLVSPELVKDWRIVGYLEIDLGDTVQAFATNPATLAGDQMKKRLDAANVPFVEVTNRDKWGFKRVKQAATEEDAAAIHAAFITEFTDAVKFCGEELDKMPPTVVDLNQAVSADQISDYIARMSPADIDDIVATTDKAPKK